MGRTDTITKSYMRDPEVFADAFNCFMYDGNQVIRPDALHELDTTGLTVLSDDNGRKFGKQTYRDILKCATAKQDGNRAYMILGIENQTGINYAMPVRVMLYDSLQYMSQTENAGHKKEISKNKTRLSSDEYISGFRKDDKVLPVITLVVYFGNKPWDGPKSLHQMIDADDGLKEYIDDYKLKLLEPALMSDDEIGKFRSDLKSVFYFIKYSENKEKLQEIIEGNSEFHRLKRSTAEMINEVTGSKIDMSEEGDEIDMCTAIREMREESRALGIEEGIEKGRNEGRIEGIKEIAKAMKDEGMDSAIIFKLTGISVETL